MFFWKRKKSQGDNLKEDKKKNELPIHRQTTVEMIEMLKKHFQHSNDLMYRHLKDHQIVLVYIQEITDADKINQNVISPIQNLDSKHLSNEVLMESINVGGIKSTNDFEEVIQSITTGWALVYLSKKNSGILVEVGKLRERALSRPENETNVYGPQIAFSEALSTNKALIRENLHNPKLCIEDLLVGKVSRTKVALFYIEGISNEENVNTMRQRIQDLEFDSVFDAANLVQLIEDNSMTIFPQLMLTERPDRLGHELSQGKVGVVIDGSSYAIMGPTTFLSFFQTTEDYYVRWTMGTFIRLVRFLATIMSIFFTPLYVLAVTFHYEIIPSDLLVQLGQTRSKVPFPPILEALFLEFTIELLREAGARLPTKVGQTMGIVGGIVIGQAAVQAGFTSNILIIIVAISALGSFTAPNYMMGNAIRIIRFPIIILAGLYGGFGVGFSIVFLSVHLLRLSSLGRPYFYPLFPFRIKEFKDTFIRMPFPKLAKRPDYNDTKDEGRFNQHRANKKKDIDE